MRILTRPVDPYSEAGPAVIVIILLAVSNRDAHDCDRKDAVKSLPSAQWE